MVPPLVHVRVSLIRDGVTVYQDLVIRPRHEQPEDSKAHADFDVLISHAAGTRQGVSGGFAEPTRPAPHEVLRTRPLLGWRRSRPGIELVQSAVNLVVARLSGRFA